MIPNNLVREHDRECHSNILSCTSIQLERLLISRYLCRANLHLDSPEVQNGDLESQGNEISVRGYPLTKILPPPAFYIRSMPSVVLCSDRVLTSSKMTLKIGKYRWRLGLRPRQCLRRSPEPLFSWLRRGHPSPCPTPSAPVAPPTCLLPNLCMPPWRLQKVKLFSLYACLMLSISCRLRPISIRL